MAIQYTAQDPLEASDLTSSVLSKTTSSGLTKHLAQNKKAVLLSPELFVIINKLMKSDEDNAMGDIQLLCKLFSGERSSYHYSTEDTRHIPANTAFSILGSTQLLNAAKLTAKMDHGHRLIDRILFATPLAFRSTLFEMEAAKTDLSTEVISDFDELFQNIHNIDHNTEYTFDEDAIALLRETIDQFVTEVNDIIQDGKVPPKSKTPELIPPSHSTTRFQSCNGQTTRRRTFHGTFNPDKQVNARERLSLCSASRNSKGNLVSGKTTDAYKNNLHFV